MIKNMKVLNPNTVEYIEIVTKITDEYEKERIKNKLIKNETKWGYDLRRKWHFRNNYDNDDYLFVADLIDTIRNIHKNFFYNYSNNQWVNGHSEIPYIHLEFILKSASKKDKDGNDVAADEYLNLGIKELNPNGTYVLGFNYYRLQRYAIFLSNLFDDNAEFIVRCNDMDLASNAGGVTKDDLILLEKDLRKSAYDGLANQLHSYIEMNPGCEVFKRSIFLKKHDNEDISGIFCFDEEKQEYTIPLKKQIFNTSGFFSLFDDRNSFISEVFVSSIKMSIAHEVAHVARGHGNLRLYDKEYSNQYLVMMNCEIQADRTAMNWLIDELLFDTVDGDPNNNILAYKKDDLIYLWAVRIFSSYLTLSWSIRGDERAWSINTLEEFLEKRNTEHPPYQFRLYCLLNNAKHHLNHLAKTNKEKEVFIVTIDGYSLNEELVGQVWNKALDFIYSFEVGLRTSYGNDDRSVSQQIENGRFIERKSMPKHKEEIPFLMAYLEKAQQELNYYEKEWPNVLEKLRQYGMYFRE